MTRTNAQDMQVPGWEQPGDERLFWSMDRMHFPYPITRLDDDFLRILYRDGLNGANALYDIPDRAQARRFWTYHYMTMVPLDLTPEERQALAASAEQKIGQTLGRLGELWETEWLPEIQANLAHWQRFDLSGAPDSELLAHLEDAIERTGRIWLLHFQIAMPAYLAMSLFDEFYRELFGDESPLRPYQLLQGLDNKTVETGIALWRLSRKAAASQAVRAVFESATIEGVIPALELSAEGNEFLAHLQQFLDIYGQRGETWGLSHPSWAEDPAPVIRSLRDYINNTEHDPERDQRALAEERERLVAEGRAALANYPEAVREQFEFLLAAAQAGVVLSEDHGFWIDFKSTIEGRKIFIEAGRRFARAGVIDAPEDIFHLSLDEIRDTFRYLPRVDRRELVVARKAEIEQYRELTPPPFVGAPPPSAEGNDPGSRVTAKFFGAPAKASDDPDVLFGAAGSPGVVRGPARVIRDLAGAALLQSGEIMIAETTAPPWTPLFATAAAVVTDTGGVLSHCAVVAREYRIPAVVGTGFATTVIADGQIIEVDGDKGVVRIVRDA